MTSIRSLALALTVLAACVPNNEFTCRRERVACRDASVTKVSTVVLDFESPCDGRKCTVTTTQGAVDYTESFHPADRAMRLAPKTIADVTFELPGDAEGAALSINARCDTGGELFFFGDRTTELPPAEAFLTATSAWRRYDRELRTPKQVHTSMESAATGKVVVHLRLENRGTAPCLLDRLVYATSARVCTNWDEIEVCNDRARTGTFEPPPDTRIADTGRRDTRLADETDPDDADAEVTDADVSDADVIDADVIDADVPDTLPADSSMGDALVLDAGTSP